MDQELLIQELEPSSSKKVFSIKNEVLIEKQPFNLLSKYNLFVHCYNHACNRVDEKTLLFVKQSRIFNSLDFILSKPSLTFLYVISFIVPVLGIFIVVYLGMASYKYFRSLKVYRKNEERVKDPFKNMRFDHVKCSQLKKNYHFITINFKSLSSQFNFKENTLLAESQRKSGQTSQWMIYNQVFASYYTSFPKYRVKLLVLLVLGIVVSLTSMILFLMILI